MEFDRNRVYTALNADELKPGSKVIVANYLESLKTQVEANSYPSYVVELSQIMGTSSTNRFKAGNKTFNLAYLISKPEPNCIVYVCRRKGVEPYLTACRSDVWESVNEIGAKSKLFEGTEEECANWYESRKHLADVIAAWEDGKDIQFRRDKDNLWTTVYNPCWDVENEYRIKPEGLKWTDLKIGRE